MPNPEESEEEEQEEGAGASEEASAEPPQKKQKVQAAGKGKCSHDKSVKCRVPGCSNVGPTIPRHLQM